jgi:hypothetical protein
VVEENETFALKIQSPTGATIGVWQALGKIIDDDRPVLYVEDARVVEGGTGQLRTAQVVVRLSAPSSRAIGAFLRTGGGIGAISGLDFRSRSDTLVVFDAGRTRQVFDVVILGDDCGGGHGNGRRRRARHRRRRFHPRPRDGNGHH